MKKQNGHTTLNLDSFKAPTKKQPEILMTKSYGMFHLLNFNRSLRKLRRLRESITNNGIWSHCPIEVDQQNNVLDGQHRLILCEELGLPVYYIRVVDVVLKTNEDRKNYIKQRNNTQQPWALFDHVHSESTTNPHYKEIEEFQERYKLGISNSITLCMGDSIRNGIVKSGKDFKLNPKRNDCADFILACRELKHSRTLPFVRAVANVFRVGKSYHIKKLLKHHMRIPQMANKEQYLTVFANIINKHVRADESKIAF